MISCVFNTRAHKLTSHSALEIRKRDGHSPDPFTLPVSKSEITRALLTDEFELLLRQLQRLADGSTGNVRLFQSDIEDHKPLSGVAQTAYINQLYRRVRDNLLTRGRYSWGLRRLSLSSMCRILSPDSHSYPCWAVGTGRALLGLPG